MDNNKMIPQHVPGPWTINPDFRKDCEQNYHIESQQGTVCFCSTGWPDDGIAEANANLIAAAPELLACCKALVKAIEEEAYIEGWDTALYSSLVDARVAILKAEGQTPKRD